MQRSWVPPAQGWAVGQNNGSMSGSVQGYSGYGQMANTAPNAAGYGYNYTQAHPYFAPPPPPPIPPPPPSAASQEQTNAAATLEQKEDALAQAIKRYLGDQPGSVSSGTHGAGLPQTQTATQSTTHIDDNEPYHEVSPIRSSHEQQTAQNEKKKSSSSKEKGSHSKKGKSSTHNEDRGNGRSKTQSIFDDDNTKDEGKAKQYPMKKLVAEFVKRKSILKDLWNHDRITKEQFKEVNEHACKQMAVTSGKYLSLEASKRKEEEPQLPQELQNKCNDIIRAELARIAPAALTDTKKASKPTASGAK